MDIRSADGKDTLVLREHGRDERYPSIGFAVEVAAAGFRGANREVWFTLEALHHVLEALRQVERDRAGSATLTSISPGEAGITCFALDRAGHIAVKVDLKHTRYLASGASAVQAVSVTFELDAAALPGIIAELAALLQA